MTLDFIQDLIESCNREGIVFVLAVGDPATGSVDVFENTEVAGSSRNELGQTTPEVLSSSIGEALGLNGNDGDWWKNA
jgi:hypothetical protein